MRALLLALSLIMMTMTVAADDLRLEKLTKGQSVSGFRVESLYLNDAGVPIGARFLHRKSGFTFDYLQIESVPQAYTWINSIPVSEQGEPHTQEHLLLGKGTVGRAFSGLDTMWLSGSTAFTQQWRTSYPFNTAAGTDVFFDLFAAQLNAMLNPNYTDEEIRREVRSFGVTENPDGTLRLEEKGSVYNEMVSSMSQANRQVFRSLSQLVYGAGHPLAMNSGGEPSGIRTMQPQHIRDFHRANYYLGNMGMIASFPKSVPLHDALRRTAATLDRAQGSAPLRKAHSLDSLPKPKPFPPATIRYVEYPHRNEQQPSPIAFVWPADRTLTTDEQVLADLFFSAFAGDPTSNVYKLFIDSKTRRMDIGAKAIFSFVNEEAGHPIGIFMTDVSAGNLNDEALGKARSLVIAELDRIAAFPDGSQELAEFNERIASRLTQFGRSLARFVNSPPGFGARGGGSQWMDHLLALEKTPEFRKSVTMKPQVAFVRGLLASKKNFWGTHLAKWKVTGVTPYVTAARPSPSLMQREESDRVARATAEAARLAKVYGTEDVQEALRRYKAEQDAASAVIEEEAKKVATPQFVKTPPMTLDDALDFQQRTAGAGVPLVVSRFDNMTSATAGIALRLDRVPPHQLRYVSLLPALLTMTGVIENGKPVPYEEMTERIRREILSLDANFSTNQRTERVELMVRGSGIGPKEAQRAIEWMSLALFSPDWRPENLARIRDVVDQSLSQHRNTMAGSEESWVNNPANAWRLQHNAAFLAADSFLTRSHNALRLRWLLKDATADDVEALRRFLAPVVDAAKSSTRADLKKLLAAPVPESLPPSVRTLAADALKDLDLTLIEIPDGTVGADVSYLADAMLADLAIPASQALGELDSVRRSILAANGARMFMVGSAEMDKTLAPRLDALASRMAKGDAGPVSKPAATRPIETRLLARESSAQKPVHVGLLAPNMRNGVITTSIPAVHFSDAGDREKQLDFLSSRLFAGAGAHGIFLKTLAAGLAYSNGLRGAVSQGRLGYYAERTPEIPQTVRFVVETLKQAPRDPKLVDYAVAQVFNEFRSANSYESRAEGIAADLADNQPPAMVRQFRTSILEIRKDPALADKLFERMDRVYGRMLPGYNVKSSEVPDGVFFVIGPDKQLDAWSEYLKSAEGSDARLFRLYGRDYWMP